MGHVPGSVPKRFLTAQGDLMVVSVASFVLFRSVCVICARSNI